MLLGDSLDLRLQQYVLKVREGGGRISSTLVTAAAKGLMLPNKQLLKEFGGHMSFSKMWTQNFLKHMGFVQRKATTSKSKYTVENFSEVGYFAE